jgi:hypothetical protein
MSYRVARMCQSISRSCFLIVESSDCFWLNLQLMAEAV